MLVHAVNILGGEFYDFRRTFLWPKAEGIGRSKPGSVNLSGISSIKHWSLDSLDTEPVFALAKTKTTNQKLQFWVPCLILKNSRST